MRPVLIGLLALNLAAPALPRAGAVHVRGYVTRNGTYVAPHYRSAPDHNPFNNWSTRGNVNPYTGKSGTKDPYSHSYGRYRYTLPSYGYVPSYGYAVPSYNYVPPAYGYASPGCLDCSTGEIPIGAVKRPANTKSGYCLQASDDYVGTGAANYPAISSAMPRCEDVVEAKKHKGVVWRPLSSSEE